MVVVHAEEETSTKYFVISESVTLNAEEAMTLDMLDVGAAKVNLEKAQSVLAGVADEAARTEIQIRFETNEALVKALE